MPAEPAAVRSSGTILDELVAATSQRMQVARSQRPLSLLREQLLEQPPARPFASRLRGLERPALIAEVKKASPSRGLIREQFDPAPMARTYSQHGARAISVLTEPSRFQGQGDYISAVKGVSPLPVLRKDFLFDPYQLYESRWLGADAVLLIAAILPQERLARLLSLTRSLGMEALVEVHDGSELEEALAAGATLLGINNRDLRSFDVDRGLTARLSSQVPDGVTLVAESGLKTEQQVLDAGKAGASAVLVGEALASQPEMSAKTRELSGKQRRVSKKMCGLTRLADVRAAAAAGCQYLGFVLAPSQRQVTPKTVQRLSGQLPVGIETVVVSVDLDCQELINQASAAGASVVQLHGSEPVEYAQRCLRAGLKVIKAGHVGTEIEGLDGYLDGSFSEQLEAILLDARAPGEVYSGGSGESFDWSLFGQLASAAACPVWLAGGLHPGNVRQALSVTAAAGVDASSGLELPGLPGLKSRQLIEEFEREVFKYECQA